MEEVCSMDLGTIKKVPPSARREWTDVVTSALANCNHHNSVESWTLLAMLPRCILGVRTKRSDTEPTNATVIKERVAR